MFGIRTPNRAVYKSSYWKIIDPIDRAHVLLVAEGVKPMAYTNFTNLGSIQEYLINELHIIITEARGRTVWLSPKRNSLHFPVRVYTIAKSPKIFTQLQVLWSTRGKKRYQDFEGKLLGYPVCCRKEYSNPTYRKKFSPWILLNFRKPFTFMLEYIIRLMDGESIPSEYNYLMPSQTPCSISCKKSLKLLDRWKRILQKYDHEALASLQEYNQHCKEKKYKAIAQALKKKGVTTKHFKKGFIFTK